jgi:hypothetical protein
MRMLDSGPCLKILEALEIWGAYGEDRSICRDSGERLLAWVAMQTVEWECFLLWS